MTGGTADLRDARGRSDQPSGKATVAGAAVLWTLVVLLFLLVPIGDQQTLLQCMGLAVRSPACEAGQQAINDAWWWLHTFPLLLAMAAGLRSDWSPGDPSSAPRGESRLTTVGLVRRPLDEEDLSRPSHHDSPDTGASVMTYRQPRSGATYLRMLSMAWAL